MQVIARQKASNTLFDEVNTSYWKLLRMSNQDVLHSIEHLLEQLRQNETLLPDFGITTADVQELETLFIAYQQVSNAPQLAKINRKVHTAKIKALITSIDVLLKQEIDLLIKVVAPTANDLYEIYTQSRKMVKVYGTKKKPVARVSSTQSGKQKENISPFIHGHSEHREESAVIYPYWWRDVG